MLRIKTYDDAGAWRMSTKDLLLAVADGVAAGETEFNILAAGQHDIGGPLWNREGKPLSLHVTNPGQRAGGMCLPGTKVVVDGAAPADVGWLNSGGEITVRGDAGDTAGHCAAGGQIYIGGRTGARTGSLMKHDPLYAEPELWILKNTGSFSFEFMSGGKAIVCGHDCLALPSVLGERPCVGMVSGTVYFRGDCPDLPEDAQMAALDENDVLFLEEGLPRFLAAIAQPGLAQNLSIWKHWRKIVPAVGRKSGKLPDMADFRQRAWFEEGLFGDVLEDSHEVAPLVAEGDMRPRVPLWLGELCKDCRACLKACPKAALRRREGDGRAIYSCEGGRCIGCGICAAVCPVGAWSMRQNAPEDNR